MASVVNVTPVLGSRDEIDNKDLISEATHCAVAFVVLLPSYESKTLIS